MKTSRKSTLALLEIVFVFLLFLTFVLAAIATLISGVEVYKEINFQIQKRYDQNTSLLYITAKIRSCNYLLSDGSSAVSIEKVGSTPVLILKEEADDVYYTYIYFFDGSIRELNLYNSKINEEKELSYGDFICNADALEIKEISDKLLFISLNSEEKEYENNFSNHAYININFNAYQE